MIFNINSTRGQTRVLTCVARVTCLVYINLRRSRVLIVHSFVSPCGVRLDFGFIQFALGSFYTDCPHKCII